MLKGSEKQIAWAEDIIREARETVKNNIAFIKNLQEKHGLKVRQDELEAYELCGKQMEEMLANIDSAAKIIDMRDQLSSANINKMVSEYCMRNKNRK